MKTTIPIKNPVNNKKTIVNVSKAMRTISRLEINKFSNLHRHQEKQSKKRKNFDDFSSLQAKNYKKNTDSIIK